MPNVELFQTTRSKVLELYSSTKRAFRCTTKPYKSTRPLVFDVTQPFPAAAPTMAHAIARMGQKLEFFAYGVGEAIDDGFGGTFKAPESWTNQGESNSTNGGNEMVIEGCSASAKAVRIKWPAGTYRTPTGPVGSSNDPDLVTAYEGINGIPGARPSTVAIGDPAGLMSPPQLDSPFNLRRMLFDLAAPELSFQFTFDRENTDKIGTLEEVPEGGGKSFLMSNGDPRTDNRYRLPEGYWWRRKGEIDSSFSVICEVEEPIVVPISLVSLFGSTPTVLPVPLQLAVDITIRVHGLQIRMDSNN